jgi:hypothetical protein
MPYQEDVLTELSAETLDQPATVTALLRAHPAEGRSRRRISGLKTFREGGRNLQVSVPDWPKRPIKMG